MITFPDPTASVSTGIAGPVRTSIRNQRILGIVLILFGMITISGCFLHYYRTNTTPKADAATLQNLIKSNKFFILHAANQNFALNHIKANAETLEADVDSLTPSHAKYLKPKNEERNLFAAKDKEVVLYEVHFYTHDSIQINSHITLPFNDFYQMDVYGLNKSATNTSKVLSIAGITVTTVAVIAIIASLSASSSHAQSSSNDSLHCSPQVYAFNGSKREIAGILYSGSIFAPLERTDYMPVPVAHFVNNKLQLQIRGGEKEELFMHETKLLQVTHPVDHNVLLDRQGKLLTYQQPVPPEPISTGSKTNIEKDITAKDDRFYSFTNHAQGQNSSEIILDFKKPVNNHSGKLLVRARNSSWAVYVFNKFKSLYGEYYQTLLKQKDKADPKKLLQCEIDQSLPLLVSVKEKDGWKLTDYFLTPGNDVLRDMIMEINLAGFENADHIQIKLETAYMFWDLDYVGMDFSDNLPCKTTFLPPRKLFKSNSDSCMDEADLPLHGIHLTDKEQLNIDFTATLNAGPGLVNAYFLMGRGYYHDNTEFEGKPQLSKLTSFSAKGAFDKFSWQTFEEMLSSINNAPAQDITAAQ